MLLQHGADPNIRNTDGKSALDLADPSAKGVLTGQSTSHFTENTCERCHEMIIKLAVSDVRNCGCKYKMFSVLSCHWNIFFHPGEYKKDELLEAAR